MVQFVSSTTPQESVSLFASRRNNEDFNNQNMRKRYVNVKPEMEEEAVAAEGRPSSFKRPKFAVPSSQQWNIPSAMHSQAACFNPLDEPSPLGLTLRKTPSLLDLIQMKLSQEDPTCLRNTNPLNQDAGRRKDLRSAAAQASADKLKASNFPVSILRIGTWECISRYEGDLVAKCYFAKHKLVWEVLDGGLKSKIEIQWSDIIALKASCPENEPGTLDIEVTRPPLFFRETNPQPRKHTLWQATSDFTGGQATIYRRHFLQCPQGLLNRHYEKLIQCDHRLNLLSNKPFLISDSPYFETRSAVFQHQNEHSYGNVYNSKPPVLPHYDYLENECSAPFSPFPDGPPPLPEMLVPKCEPSELEASIEDSTHQETTRHETTSPSSVMDSRAIEDHGSSDNDELNMKGSKESEQLRFLESLDGLSNQGSGLALSTSMSNLVNQIGICFHEQRPAGSFASTGEDTSASNKKILDVIAQHLLSDCLLSSTCDEQSIIARVNSMCSLLQKDVPIEHASEMNLGKGEEPLISYSMGSCPNGDGEDENEIDDERSGLLGMDDFVSSHLVENSSVDSKCTTVMSRKESSGDLLLHLPRIASLPQFFIQASDELATRNESNGMVGGTHLR